MLKKVALGVLGIVLGCQPNPQHSFKQHLEKDRVVSIDVVADKDYVLLI